MTITSYFVQHAPGRADADARAAIHLINDLAFTRGDHLSWDATRALVDSVLDSSTQERLGLHIVAEEVDMEIDD